MASERELKRQPKDLATARQMVSMIVDQCEFDDSAPDLLRSTSRYIDTENYLLGRGRVGLRARGDMSKQEARWTVKVGALPDDQGVSEATEVEIDGFWREIPSLFSMALRSVGVSTGLTEIARFSTERERWIRRFAGVEVEICMDSVIVEFPTQFSFLEIEVEAPGRSELDQLLVLIDSRFPDVAPSPGSKLAMALSGGDPKNIVNIQLASEPVGEDLGAQLTRFLDSSSAIPAPWEGVGR